MTLAFRPWTSDTTAMIDVTATMLPSTVSSERSLFAQMACSAMRRRLEELLHLACPSVDRSACAPVSADDADLVALAQRRAPTRTAR